jgi:ABC-type spermidine/putrescine transport system permease subunit II
MTDLQQLITDFLTTSTTYGELTVDRVVLALIMSFLINLLILVIYRKTFKGVVYNRQFGVGLVLTGLVVTLVVLPISSNVALSLGMIGALSIIRFRTAIKDPKDIVFTFWTITVGIICGAGLYIVGIVGVPIIAGMFLILDKAKIKGSDPYLLVVHYSTTPKHLFKQHYPNIKLGPEQSMPKVWS